MGENDVSFSTLEGEEASIVEDGVSPPVLDGEAEMVEGGVSATMGSTLLTWSLG